MKRRVVVTGMGAVTPIGNNVQDFWNGIKNGKCGIDFIKAFDTSDFKAKLAAEVKDFNPEDCLSRKEARRMDRFCQFAISAADEAYKSSGLNFEDENRERIGVLVGSGIGGLATIEKEEKKLIEKGPNRVSPMLIPMIIGNMAAGNVAIRYGAKGVCSNVVTACATGTNAIGDAARLIQYGDADIMIAGGTEASITPLAIAGFASLTAVSKSTDPDRASIPFDKERDGFVMGEGSGILILEEFEHALKRGAHIFAEFAGYGETCDAYHITSPAPGGEGAARAMKLAINDAKITPYDISYINAHGTGTLPNDKNESEAFKTVFGKNAYNIPISSTKSMTGHLLGAAGAIEAIVCIKSICDSFVPATINLKVKDENCDLDYVPNEGRTQKVKYTMSNSLGFGGHNAVVIFKNFEK